MAKRGENIYRRKDGRWEGRYISGRTQTGKAILSSVYGKTYGEVKEKLNSRKGSPVLSPPNYNLTVKTMMEPWLSFRSVAVKPSSYQHYQRLMNNHIVPRLGSIRVSHLSAANMAHFISELQRSGRKDGTGGLSEQTICDILCVLHSALHQAKKKNIILDESIFDVKVASPLTKAVETMSEPDCEKLSRLILDFPTMTGAAILFGLYYGLRIGEVCGLKWEDIYRSAMELSIRHTISRLKDGAHTHVIVQTAKTEKSVRVIPITSDMLDLLSHLRNTRDDNAFILTGSISRPKEPRVLLQQYRAFLAKNGIQYHRFHALRHTFATRCIEHGYDPKTLSEILGHKNVKTTLQLYVHPTMSRKRELIEALSPFSAVNES